MRLHNVKVLRLGGKFTPRYSFNTRSRAGGLKRLQLVSTFFLFLRGTFSSSRGFHGEIRPKATSDETDCGTLKKHKLNVLFASVFLSYDNEIVFNNKVLLS